MAEPMLLAFNLDQKTAFALSELCRWQQIRYRAVTALEYALPIGALAGIPVQGNSPGTPSGSFSEPMLVMCHMLRGQLDAFLLGMRESNIPRIDLKAVLTPVNLTWNARQLRDELAREHEAVQRMKRSAE